MEITRRKGAKRREEKVKVKVLKRAVLLAGGCFWVWRLGSGYQPIEEHDTAQHNTAHHNNVIRKSNDRRPGTWRADGASAHRRIDLMTQ